MLRLHSEGSRVSGVGLRLLITAICLFSACTTTLDETRQATGVRIGEVTENSAIIWTRITEKTGRRTDGMVRRKRADKDNPEQLNPRDLEGSVPGAEGRVHVVPRDAALITVGSLRQLLLRQG